MEKQLNQARPIILAPHPSLGILGILREAFKVTVRNGKAVIWIMFPVFLSLSLLELGAHLVLAPVLTDLSSKAFLLNKNPKGSEVDESLWRGIVKDVWCYLVLQLVFLIFSFVVFINFLVVAVSLSSEAYMGKIMKLEDMIKVFGGRWKNSVTTMLYTTLIGFSVMVLFSILLMFIAVFFVEGVFLTLSINALVIFGVVCFAYVATVCMLSLAVSVVEVDCSGLRAIDKAGELMKGKRLQGSVIMLLFAITIVAVYATFFVTMKIDGVSMTQFAVRITRTWLIWLVKFFMFVVYTVFYHECKRSQAEASWAKVEVVGYVPIASEGV